jgi:hypothetical protein
MKKLFSRFFKISTILFSLTFPFTSRAAQPADSAVIENMEFLQQMDLLQTQELLAFYSDLDRKKLPDSPKTSSTVNPSGTSQKVQEN